MRVPDCSQVSNKLFIIFYYNIVVMTVIKSLSYLMTPGVA